MKLKQSELFKIILKTYKFSIALTVAWDKGMLKPDSNL